MNDQETFDMIADRIRKEVIFEGLELEEMDVKLEDIKNDTPIFVEDGLGLDSVDALEIIAGIQRCFDISLADVAQEEIQRYLVSVETLTQAVIDFRAQQS